MSVGEVIVVRDDATREQITIAIEAMKSKHDRLPKHFVAKRQEVMDEIENLVDDWIAAES